MTDRAGGWQLDINDRKFIRTCSIWRTLEVGGDTATLLILESALIGSRRFDEFCTRTGILRALLSDRLKKLIAAGVLKKVPYSQAPLRHEYRLTHKGWDLYWAAMMMLRWERRWAPRVGKIDIVLHHQTCGHDFNPVPSCACCRHEIKARDMTWQEGPGVGWMAATYSRRRRQRDAVTVGTTLMDEVAQITGDRWAGLILRSIFIGLRKFDEIYRDTAMATNILSERLGWLVTMGIIETQEYSATPPRYEYRLTEKGIDYYPILLMLLQWGDKYYVSPEGPPLLINHNIDGQAHQLEPVVSCSACGVPIEPQHISYRVVEATDQARTAS